MMNTRRLVALIFNMVATCMNLLVYALFCLLNLVASLSYSRFGGYAFFSFALFGALTTLVVLNIVHFIRHTKNQYNSFDKYSITFRCVKYNRLYHYHDLLFIRYFTEWYCL